jgi:16S rRNA (cytosine1402-N4)-methyltransferase
VSVASARIAEALSDRPEAERPRVEVVHASFSELRGELASRGVEAGGVHGILADLGVSSPQLDEPGRGFSFRHDGPLDMRMDRSQGPSAADLVASLSETELADIIFRYGDERDSRRIARSLVARRALKPFVTTADLAAVIAAAKGPVKRRKNGPSIHPATKSFQALRIATNGELDQLDSLLSSALSALEPSGRLAVITFHSGEDRPVKQTFASWARGPELPPAQAIFRSHGEPLVRLPHPKGVAPGRAEVAANPRARSARLRVAEKLS